MTVIYYCKLLFCVLQFYYFLIIYKIGFFYFLRKGILKLFLF